MTARAKPATALEWTARNVRGDFYSSECGRFDLYYSADSRRRGVWIAHDWETGRTVRNYKYECQLWCAEQAAEYPSEVRA